MNRTSIWAAISLAIAATPALAGMPGQSQDQDPVEQAAQGANTVFHNVYNMQKREYQALQQEYQKAMAKVGDWEVYFKAYTTKQEKK